MQVPFFQRLGQQLRPLVRAHANEDTVAAWPPVAARLLNAPERLAHSVLQQALPDCQLFVHVPLARLVRVPNRRSYNEWLSRISGLSADFAICDRSSQVIGTVLLSPREETPRGKLRRERLARVLRAAGLQVVEWQVGWQPHQNELRQALGLARL
ncbi:hypothetical protein HNQ51_000768 [Inhella inkyongensis]|uniref:DUF2726 domain-containing protein n=1 Tax=Inhella inkyongensis TaxID=392593 RepID=A0A840RZP9_9BURK|nr:DUF2726 domain-containing protein [Inhella inkyongensis]MBB5203475.1 hypothetical protein [Inhella inkyongensis]